MKISKIIISLSVLALIFSCTAFKDKELTSIRAKKIITVNSTVGQFLFTVDGKEKVEGGYKFNFIVGNKNYAQYEGLQLKVRWGKNPAKKGKKSKISTKDLNAENVTLKVLKAGEWQEFSVIIPAKNEEEMEILNLAVFAVDKIALSGLEISDD